MLNVTPKLKLLILLNNTNLFLLFLKLDLILKIIKININHSLNFFFIFNKFFFSFFLIKLIKKSNQKFLSYYTSNIVLSLIFLNFKKINLILLTNMYIFKNIIKISFYYNYNIYFLSIKLIKTNILKKFYKNFFFNILLFWIPIWYQHNLFFNFHLNFIFVIYSLNAFKFYNGPFLKIYNF